MAIVEIHPECLREDLSAIQDRTVIAGILEKISILKREPGFGKPLAGALLGHRRITYGRYRIVYRWDQSRNHVLVWYVGLRKEELYRAIESAARRRVRTALRRFP
ncbi:MAG: type II toxin-antitoxin system RelE/ParE family toxin [Armatimonadota bacterium]|nr:type II toxin-antitoxin system RelE/ParE family toxin [Armatimonadota bacterium]